MQVKNQLLNDSTPLDQSNIQNRSGLPLNQKGSSEGSQLREEVPLELTKEQLIQLNLLQTQKLSG